MDKLFRMTYVTFEERNVPGQTRPRTSPVYHVGRNVYSTPQECIDANAKWIAEKILSNMQRGIMTTRIEFNALSASLFEGQPE